MQCSVWRSTQQLKTADDSAVSATYDDSERRRVDYSNAAVRGRRTGSPAVHAHTSESFSLSVCLSSTNIASRDL